MGKDYSEFLDKDLCDALKRKRFDVERVELNNEEMYIELHTTTTVNRQWYPSVVVDRDATLADIADAIKESAKKFDVNRETALAIRDKKYTCEDASTTPYVQGLLDDTMRQKITFMELARDLQREFADNDKPAVKGDIEIERD